MIDYLVTLHYIDEDRIGVLAICGGGGCAVNATMTERRIKALGTITGANYGLHRQGTRQALAKLIPFYKKHL